MTLYNFATGWFIQNENEMSVLGVQFTLFPTLTLTIICFSYATSLLVFPLFRFVPLEGSRIRDGFFENRKQRMHTHAWLGILKTTAFRRENSSWCFCHFLFASFYWYSPPETACLLSFKIFFCLCISWNSICLASFKSGYVRDDTALQLWRRAQVLEERLQTCPLDSWDSESVSIFGFAHFYF